MPRAPRVVLRTCCEDGAQISSFHSSLDVNLWIATPPSVGAVRPGVCPRCGAAGAVPGQPLGLIGHGLRERQLRGPPSANSPASTLTLRARRYRCRRCTAIVAVVPRQVLARRHFAAGAIALAVFAFGKLGSTAAAAASRIGSWARGPGGWRTLRRWLAAIDEGRLFACVRGSPDGWSPRQRAERAAMTVAALVPASVAIKDDARVFAGASFAT